MILPPLCLPANRRTLRPTAFGVSALAFVAALLTGLAVNQDQPRFVDWLGGSCLTLYGSYLSYYYWSHLLRSPRSSPALRVDDQGLEDRTAFSGAGFLPWTAIAKIEPCVLPLKSGGREPALGIAVTGDRRRRWRQWPVWLWFRWPPQPWTVVILERDLDLPPGFDLARAIATRQPAASHDA